MKSFSIPPLWQLRNKHYNNTTRSGCAVYKKWLRSYGAMLQSVVYVLQKSVTKMKIDVEFVENVIFSSKPESLMLVRKQPSMIVIVGKLHYSCLSMDNEN